MAGGTSIVMGEYWWRGDFHSYGGILVVAGGTSIVMGEYWWWRGTSIVMGEYWWWRGGLP